MFFEAHHSTAGNHFLITRNSKERGFPLHIHRSFECYAVTAGNALAIIDGKEYILSAGDAVLVFPYQRHEYFADAGAASWVCIFSPDIVSSFNKGASLIPESNKFLFEPWDITPENDILRKAMCYGICGLFDANAKYVERESDEDDLLSKILTYISKSYTKACTLRDAALAVGYDYSYISKFFKKMTGVNFKKYVTAIKIDEACRMLSSGNYTITEVAEASGFSCTRTFNREFLEIVGKTPREFAKSLDHQK
ncbi:MAG: AraC family transcriptional regulator [Ruminococcaceae bacterium]|nr:AraC family transcriptional regulator [Oscillospiraceae bacterium]